MKDYEINAWGKKLTLLWFKKYSKEWKIKRCDLIKEFWFSKNQVIELEKEWKLKPLIIWKTIFYGKNSVLALI